VSRSGAHSLLTDFDYRYQPGSLVILLSGQLYHGVTEWAPGKQEAGDDVTPGRIGNVFFFPKASFDKLKGKPPGWKASTMSGSLPNVQESKL
jgi:hypothetical protein